MKEVTPGLANVLDFSHSIKNYVEVVMEIEVNGYYDYTLDFPAPLNPNIFSEDSVMRSRRPDGGLPKFIGNESILVSKDISSPVYSKDRNFYRVATEDSSYKYYRSSKLSSDSESESGGFEFDQPLEFIVDYNEVINFNNLVIGFEYANALPEEVEVLFLSEDGEESWVSEGVFYPEPFYSDGEDQTQNFQSAGKVLINFNEGVWSEGYSPSEEFFQTSAIKIIVSAMDQPERAVELIQISPRIVSDLTERVVQLSSNNSREVVELSSPVGIMSTSSASITLDNSDGIFNNENQDSPYYQLLDVNIKFVVKDAFLVGDEYEMIPAGVFYANSWNLDSEGTISVDSSSYGKFLQNKPINNCFYNNESIIFVIMDILEKSEITDYEIRYTAEDSKTRIPFVFFQSEYSVWDSLQSLASAEQAVFYFDDSGRFIWESRDYVWSKDGNDPEPVFIFRADDEESGLANLVKYNYSHDFIANKSLVYTTPTDFAKRGDELINNFIWQASEDTVLISSPVVYIDDEIITVREEDFELFPNSGVVNVDAEFIRYEKPEDPEVKNLIIKERALYNSDEKQHFVSEIFDEWTLKIVSSGESESSNLIGTKNVSDSKLTLSSNISNINNIVKYETGQLSDRYSIYGADIFFPVTEDDIGNPAYSGDGIAGLYIHSSSNTSGYFFEIMTTEYATLEQNKKREARIWKYDSQGNIEVLAGFYPEDLASLEEEELREVTGEELLVFPGTNYKVAVFYEPFVKIVEGSPVNTANLTFSVNGKRIIAVEDNSFNQGKWGVYVRSQTEAEFEYVYAIRNISGVGNENPLDLSKSQISIRDQISGGFIDNTLENFFSAYNNLKNFFFFEDFGAWAREVKEFDVKYEMQPSMTSEIFISNESSVYIIYHSRDQFSSKFAIGNRNRSFTVLQGNDPVQQASMVLAIYGTPIIQKEKNEIKSEDEKSIWRRGPEEIIVDTPWIQTEDHGNRVSEWFASRWSRPLEVVNLESFVDPRVELGDLVAISAPALNITKETHKFHIISISSNKGPENSVSLTLRRALY